MHTEPDDLQMYISQCRTMDIEELKSNIDDWEGKDDSFIQLENLDIAKNELELKYKERQEQIELLLDLLPFHQESADEFLVLEQFSTNL